MPFGLCSFFTTTLDNKSNTNKTQMARVLSACGQRVCCDHWKRQREREREIVWKDSLQRERDKSIRNFGAQMALDLE